MKLYTNNYLYTITSREEKVVNYERKKKNICSWMTSSHHSLLILIPSICKLQNSALNTPKCEKLLFELLYHGNEISVAVPAVGGTSTDSDVLGDEDDEEEELFNMLPVGVFSSVVKST